jgi:hypothetical protein
MNRLILVVIALSVTLGCSTLATLDGARPLEPGAAQFGVGVSVQRGGTPLSYSGIPIPQVELAARFGIAPDVDFGLRAYLLGAAFDVRYRVWHRDRLHLAVAPGMAGLWIPGIAGAAGQGSVEWRVPVTGEVEAADWISIAGGPRFILRDQWNSVAFPSGDAKGLVGRLDVFAGGGARVELHGRALFVGFGGDVYVQPVRHGGVSWSVGSDFGFRSARHRDD